MKKIKWREDETFTEYKMRKHEGMQGMGQKTVKKREGWSDNQKRLGTPCLQQGANRSQPNHYCLGPAVNQLRMSGARGGPDSMLVSTFNGDLAARPPAHLTG